jgi:peptidoglycan/LPS O-acetylase OafA/YrhL
MPSQAPERVSELDGIRGIAILVVMLYHIGMQTPAHPTYFYRLVLDTHGFGWCGVDLFFVLSGFLITGILLDSKGSRNYFSVFYIRRALRILPLYYLAVFLLFQVIPPAAHRFGWSWTEVSSTEQIWYWLHISNWRTAFVPLIYPEVSHFWSLAVEEQFYVLWPMLVLVCSRSRLLHLCAYLILGCIVIRNLPAVQILAAQYNNMLYRLTPFRMDSLLFGACAALISRNQQWAATARPYLWWVFASGIAGIAIVVAAAGTTSAYSGPMTRFGFSALGLTFACAVLLTTWHAGSDGIVARLLRGKVLTNFGKYSYAMYVVHASLAPCLVPRIDLPGFRPLAVGLRVLMELAATYLLALLSWNCIERHFLQFKSRFPYSRIEPAVAETTLGAN